jgi:hypothetical protein
MNENPPSNELQSASQLIGADILFLQLVEQVATQLTGAPTVADTVARQRIGELHDEFRSACAAIVLQRLGSERALPSLTALASAPVQRFLIARQTMAPALAKELLALKHRMGKIEL